MRHYTPRRAGQRWLAGAPEYVLDCIRHKREDGSGFDVLFTGSLLGTIEGQPQDFSHVYVMALEVTAAGERCSFELSALQAAQFRYANKKRRVKWADLPSEVRARCERVSSGGR